MPQARSVRGISGSDSRLPLYQRLRDEFLLQIAEGRWVPGTPIPTEVEMTREYEVAIGTVRKAIDTLVQDGILDRQQGRGTFVRRPEFTRSLSRFFRQVDQQGNTCIPESDILSLGSEPASQHVRQALALKARGTRNPPGTRAAHRWQATLSRAHLATRGALRCPARHPEGHPG